MKTLDKNNNRQRSCPGRTCDNSPTFQRWVDQRRDHQVLKGRLKRRAMPQPSLRDWTAISLVLPNVETLGYCRASLRDEEQILVALDLSTPAPEDRRTPLIRYAIGAVFRVTRLSFFFTMALAALLFAGC